MATRSSRADSDSLVKAVHDPHLVRSLITEGHSVTFNAVCAAIMQCSVEALELMLSTGIDPNAKPDSSNHQLDSSVTILPNEDLAPEFRDHRSDWNAVHTPDWYLLQYAAYTEGPSPEAKDSMSQMIALLLSHGADVFALFRQPLRSHLPSYFPGEPEEQGQSESDQEWNCVDEEFGPRTYPPRPRPYGLRSIIHAILEDGAYSQPIFQGGPNGRSLDLEHRDPYGRTLLLSSCRSALGADAMIDGVLEDTRWDPTKGGMERNPYKTDQGSKPTLFHALVSLGADLTACDLSGKNALHHLFEAHDPSITDSWRPPVIRNALQYLLKQPTSLGLVNQPDTQGLYPLHAAFQRLRRYPNRSAYVEIAESEAAIDDLLNAGADPSIPDPRGNTTLHYLAAARLADRFYADSQRRWFKRFVCRGVDVNARNKLGRSALELLLEDAEACVERDMKYTHLHRDPATRQPEDVNDEVLKYFDDAGVKWTERNPSGWTLLHVLAKYDTESFTTAERAEVLLANGVDPLAKNQEGQTAAEIANECGNQDLSDFLAEKEY